MSGTWAQDCQIASLTRWPLSHAASIKWSQFLCNFIAWICIERTCIETTFYQHYLLPDSVLCPVKLQRSGFVSRSSLNFFRFFFNRLGCSFYCGDHVHFHIFVRSSKYDSVVKQISIPYCWTLCHVSLEFLLRKTLLYFCTTSNE